MKKRGFLFLALALMAASLLLVTVGKPYVRQAGIRVTKAISMFVAQKWTTEAKTSWFGIPMLQFPSDLWIYQEMIQEHKPDLIIETGTYEGGLTLYLAMMLDYVHDDQGRVITVDIYPDRWVKNVAEGKIKKKYLDRIAFLEGSSTAPEIIAQIAKQAEGKNALVILDSLHTKDHVLQELELYSQFVPVGGYIIVNDTHHDRLYSLSGPMAAVREFLKRHDNFVEDESKDKFLVSCFHSGLLKRIK